MRRDFVILRKLKITARAGLELALPCDTVVS